MTDPFAAGVTEFGLKAHDTPAGTLAQESETALLKLPVDVTVQVLVPELFRCCVSEAGLQLIVKFGVVAVETVTCSVVLCVRPPLVPCAWTL